MAMVLSVFLLGSCAKDGPAIENTASTEKLSSADLAKIKQIERFTAAMTAQTVNRTEEEPSEYTPAEFVLNTEESINYTYALPFEKFWDVETKKDSIIVTINNCKIISSEAPSKYLQILNKVICQYTCAGLTNKQFKFAKISLSSETCSQIKVYVETTVGSTDLTASIGEPDVPDPSELSRYRRTFTESLWAIYGTCSNQTWGDPITATELTKKATYNLTGGADLVHTLVDVESRYLSSYNNPQTNWWFLNCFDYRNETCGSQSDCDLYFYRSNLTWLIDFASMKQLGKDQHCLTASKLNSILNSTESYCQGQATIANKLVINIVGDWASLACFDYDNFWVGYLTLGRKIYRPQQPQNFPYAICNCE
jgi:hypothetical protein